MSSSISRGTQHPCDCPRQHSAPSAVLSPCFSTPLFCSVVGSKIRFSNSNGHRICCCCLSRLSNQLVQAGAPEYAVLQDSPEILEPWKTPRHGNMVLNIQYVVPVSDICSVPKNLGIFAPTESHCSERSSSLSKPWELLPSPATSPEKGQQEAPLKHYPFVPANPYG